LADAAFSRSIFIGQAVESDGPAVVSAVLLSLRLATSALLCAAAIPLLIFAPFALLLCCFLLMRRRLSVFFVLALQSRNAVAADALAISRGLGDVLFARAVSRGATASSLEHHVRFFVFGWSRACRHTFAATALSLNFDYLPPLHRRIMCKICYNLMQFVQRLDAGSSAVVSAQYAAAEAWLVVRVSLAVVFSSSISLVVLALASPASAPLVLLGLLGCNDAVLSVVAAAPLAATFFRCIFMLPASAAEFAPSSSLTHDPDLVSEEARRACSSRI
jgi:hypothetical protein